MKRGSATNTVTRRVVVQSGVAGVGGLLAAACGGQGAQGESKTALAGEVEFWGLGEPETAEIAKRFGQKNSGVKMNFSVPPGLQDKLIVAVAAGTPPDIAAGLQQTISTLGSKNLAEPAEDVLKGSRWSANDMLEGIRTAVSYKGKILATPYITDSSPVALNLDLLSQAGLKLPAKNWTWTDLADYATKLTVRTGGETKVWGMQCSQAPAAGDDAGQTYFGQVLYSFGGTYVDAAGEKATFASPQGIAALEYWVNLIQKLRVSPLPWPPKWIDDGTKGDLVVPGFNDGSNGGAAMRLLLTASLKGVRAGATFKWTNVMAPQQPKLASSLSGGNWFQVKGTRRKDLATALLRHLADTEQLAMYAASIQRLPTYKSVINHKLYQDFMKSVPELQVHWDMLQGAYPKVPNVVGWNDGQPALRTAIGAALRGEVTPSAALQDAARQMDTALATGRTG